MIPEFFLPENTDSKLIRSNRNRSRVNLTQCDLYVSSNLRVGNFSVEITLRQSVVIFR